MKIRIKTINNGDRINPPTNTDVPTGTTMCRVNYPRMTTFSRHKVSKLSMKRASRHHKTKHRVYLLHID